jgi:site-specific DNA-methyltransferase (adenine-specific)
MELNKIYNVDCIEYLKSLPDDSIQLILQDPPYNTTACKWEWDLMSKIDELWSEWFRVLKPNGSIVLFGTDPFTSRLICSNLTDFKYNFLWHKSRKNGFVHAKGMPLRETENISVFSKGGIRRNSEIPMLYNPQGVKEFSKKRINYVKTTSAYSGGHEVGTEYEQDGSNYPTNILKFNNESPKTQFHPTQKPVPLLEYLVKTYTNEDDVVFDGFMGSGSTAIACMNTNRNYLGCELDPDMFVKSLERIQSNVNLESIV